MWSSGPLVLAASFAAAVAVAVAVAIGIVHAPILALDFALGVAL